jgi:hypothetical protein
LQDQRDEREQIGGSAESTPGVDWGGRPRTQGREDDPRLSVSLHVQKSHLTKLDQLADAAHMSRAALMREVIDRLLTRLKHP